jgi:hypothetical protein
VEPPSATVDASKTDGFHRWFEVFSVVQQSARQRRGQAAGAIPLMFAVLPGKNPGTKAGLESHTGNENA